MGKKIRKPRQLWTKGKEVYAGFDVTKDCIVYIGGPYYQSHDQIHLKTKEQVLKLAKWLSRVAAYMTSQETKKDG